MKTVPELAEFGAYSMDKIYTPGDIRELVEYARVRGVKVVPELDAPAHVGNGWQFAEMKHPEWGRLAVCVNQEEWQDYCVEPPCGQVCKAFTTNAFQALRSMSFSAQHCQ